MKRRIGTLARWALLAFVLMTLPAFAADPITPGTINQAASNPQDRSRQALTAVFGNVVTDPFGAGASGGGDSVMASIFQVINEGLLAIAGLFVGYIMIRKLVQGAHDGSAFDSRRHLFWENLRVVWGITALVPTASGWSLAQLVMLWAVAYPGVGLANLATQAGLTAFMNGQGMVVQPVIPSTMVLARKVFEADLCMSAINTNLSAAAQAGGLTDGNLLQQRSIDPTRGYGFILSNGVYSCGGAIVPVSAQTGDNAAMLQAQQEGLVAMQTVLSPAALNYVQGYVQLQQGTGSALPNPNVMIVRGAEAYQNSLAASATQANATQQNEQASLTEAIQNGGWWMLGSYYMTFATLNNQASDAANNVAQIIAPAITGAPGMLDTYTSVMTAYHSQANEQPLTPAIGTPDSNTQAASSTTGADATETNDGQGSVSGAVKKIAPFMQRFLADVLSSGNANNQQINPLIRMQSIGNLILGLGTLIMAAWAVLFGAATAVGKSVLGLAGAGVAVGVLKAVSPYVTTIVLFLFFSGAMLAVYLPLLPFIIWMGAVINWLAIVGEGLIAAPLWAMSHLNADGEGAGQQSQHGWTFLLVMMTRPLLMVVGFFLASGLVVVGGTFLNEGLLAAMANLSVDSMVGIISLIVTLIVYVSLGTTLVTMCFSLVLVVADQVPVWIGARMPDHPGRDMAHQSRSIVAGGLSRGESGTGSVRNISSRPGAKALGKDNAGEGGGDKMLP